MNFRKKASALALCAVLLGTSIAPVSAATHEEIVGKNRYETAAMIADKMGDYETAILVNSDKSLADGLSASSLAGKENAPILLTSKDKLPAATEKRLEKVKKVYIIGGKKAITDIASASPVNPFTTNPAVPAPFTSFATSTEVAILSLPSTLIISLPASLASTFSLIAFLPPIM